MELTSREWVDMGGFAWDKEAYDAAIECYTHALEIDPTLYVAYLYRGLVHTQIEKFKEAIKDFGNGIKICDDASDREILFLAKAFSELQIGQNKDFYNTLKCVIADENWNYDDLDSNPFFHEWMKMNPEFALFVEFGAYQAILRHKAA